jgi:menaquinone-dependent protoporphyrinogen oxidase
MKQRMLIVYATRAGSTEEVAAEIGGIVTETGVFSVDVFPIKAVKEIDAYAAVVIGSAVRMGRWLPEAVTFVSEHQEQLRQIPTAFFTVCMTLKDDTDENRETVHAYLEPIRDLVQPRMEGYFAGAMQYDKVSRPTRWLMRAMDVPEGDFRRWDRIDQWAGSLSSAMQESAAKPGIS